MSESDEDAVVERMAEAAFLAAEQKGEFKLRWAGLHGSLRDHYRMIIRAVLATTRPGDPLPGGLVVVPVEPTETMVDIGFSELPVDGSPNDVYRAMIRAASEEPRP